MAEISKEMVALVDEYGAEQYCDGRDAEGGKTQRTEVAYAALLSAIAGIERDAARYRQALTEIMCRSTGRNFDTAAKVLHPVEYIALNPIDAAMTKTGDQP
jgi:hypothetical protein